jgi:S-adenosyl methyltransferase
VSGNRAVAVRPAIVRDIRANRDFMRRAVAYLATQDIRQFLDIGTGILTQPNLREVVQDIAPATRIVYADNDRCKLGLCTRPPGLPGHLKRTRERKHSDCSAGREQGRAFRASYASQ